MLEAENSNLRKSLDYEQKYMTYITQVFRQKFGGHLDGHSSDPLPNLFDKLQNFVGALEKQSGDFHKIAKGKSIDLASAEKKNAALEKRLAAAKHEINKLSTTLAEKKVELTKAEQEKAELQTRLEGSEEQKNKHFRSLSEKRTQLARAAQKYSGLRTQLEACKKENSELLETLTSNKKDAELNLAALSESQLELKSLQNQVAEERLQHFSDEQREEL